MQPGSLLLCACDKTKCNGLGKTGTQEASSDLQGKLVLTQKFSPQKSYRTHYKSTYKLILVNKHHLHAGDSVSSQTHSIIVNSGAQYISPFHQVYRKK